MFIECPSCKTRAQLPSSKEGAKVRCPQCSRVFVAREASARGRSGGSSKQDPLKYVLIGGGVVAVAVVGMLVSRSQGRKIVPAAASTKEVVEEPVETSGGIGWSSALVQRAVELHGLVHSKNLLRLLTSIDFEHAYAWRQAADAAEAEEAAAAAAAAGDGTEAPAPAFAPAPEWAVLADADRKAFQDQLVERLVSGVDADLVALWEPYDGQVVSEDDGHAVVHLLTHHRDDPTEADRTVKWTFVRDGDRWLATSWQRWFSPDELKTARARKTKTVKRTLADGSQVIEGVVRTEIDYHESTPPELRTEIEQQIDVLVAPSSSAKSLTAARMRLEEIGKHSVPGLLKRMGAIPLDSDQNLVALNQLHLELQQITGYLTTFDVHVAMGTTAERQDSGVKQWFGWYDRKFKRWWDSFDAAGAEDDVLWDDPNFQPRNEKERKEFEKLRAQHEASKGDG